MKFLNWPVDLDRIEVGKPVAFGKRTIAWVIDKKTVPDSDTISLTRVKVQDRSGEESPWLQGDTYVFELEELLAFHEMKYLYHQK